MREDQWVQNLEFNENARYIVGEVDQKTLSLTARINVNITPDFTIQYSGQPFVSKGNYTDFKYVTDPLGHHFADRTHRFSESEILSSDGSSTIQIDETGDGVQDYQFNRPDFHFIQFRSNFVARWEYVPGSEIYFVWSQGTTSFGDPSDKLIPSLTDNLFNEKITNTFLIKWTYRLVL